MHSEQSGWSCQGSVGRVGGPCESGRSGTVAAGATQMLNLQQSCLPLLHPAYRFVLSSISEVVFLTKLPLSFVTMAPFALDLFLKCAAICAVKGEVVIERTRAPAAAAADGELQYLGGKNSIVYCPPIGKLFCLIVPRSRLL